MLRYVNLRTVIGVLFVILVSLAVGYGTMQMEFFYKNRALKQESAQLEQECTVLGNQILNDQIDTYSMHRSTEDQNNNIRSLQQLAANINGRILLVDDRFQILSDTYHQSIGKFLVTRDVIHAFNSKEVSNRVIDDSLLQVIVPVIDKDENLCIGAIVAMTKMHDSNTMLNYLHRQRTTLMVLMVLLSLVFGILIIVFIRRSFSGIQNKFDAIAEGHEDEQLDEDGFKEFQKIAHSYNKTIDRYKELESTRQEFVSNVSHELKTPITSMKILADSLISQKDVPLEIYQEFMGDIAHEIDRENQIINDLLTLVKMDRNQGQLNISQVNVNAMLEELLKRISPIAEQRDIKIRLETMRQVTAEADEVKLSLACNNLIVNAVKYNKDGGSVLVSLNADHKFCYIRVKDTGVGIPEDCQDKIFERFYRVDKARSRDTGGTGLGLSITRNVVLLHKGSIRVHSKLGEGTTFLVRIPLNYVG